MIYTCTECGKQFENNRKRQHCFDCKPKIKLNQYSSEEERMIAKRKQAVKKIQKYRKNLKKKAIEYKGGKCIICGYDKCEASLCFHHLDPLEKDFGVSSHGWTHSWNKIISELDKCVLVCANCHGEIHQGLINLDEYIY